MRILAALVLVGATMSVGCSTPCGSFCNGGKCTAETQPTGVPTKTVAAKPKGMPTPKGVTTPEIVPVNHERVSSAQDEPVVPADHETVMPDDEPTASLVPPPPSAARLSESDSNLPSPAEIAGRSANFSAMPKVPLRDDDWNESPSEEAPAATGKPSQWSSRSLASPPVGN